MMWLVAIAGGLGAAARFFVDGVVNARRHLDVPLGSWVVNVVGSFLLGMVVGSLQGVTALVLGTGFLGGFTTFSTFTLESARLAHERRSGAAAMLALSGLVTSVAAAALGWALVG